MLLLAVSAALVGSAGAWTVNPALRATPVVPEAAHALVVAKSSQDSKGPLDSCGKAPTYDNATPKNYEDAMKTKFNTETKKREEVTFKTSDEIEFKCNAGFTIDGSKDGETTFKAVCSEQGYFKPDGTCIKASKCGSVPEISHATATAKKIEGAVQFACNPGYSLDGNKVVAGGMGKNQLFTLKCQDFNNEYEKFEGECKAYAFVPSKETTRIYTKVFEALFTVTCKGKLVEAFGKGKAPPVDSACGKLQAGSGECAGLVSEIKSAFDAAKEKMKTYKEEKEWYDSEDKPGVADDAQKFCEGLYKLVEKPNDL